MPDPFERIPNYYGALIQRYGHDPRACDYGRPESQAIKFAVLADVMNLSDCAILDVGCGFADMAAFLATRYGPLRYAGIDLTPEMIETARRLHPSIDLRVANILDDPRSDCYDVVIANGLFYLLGDDASTLMRRIVRRMFERSTRAVAFNSLSSWGPDPSPNEFYANPIDTLEYCRSLTPWVTLRHDYHSRDFTIYLYRDRQA